MRHLRNGACVAGLAFGVASLYLFTSGAYAESTVAVSGPRVGDLPPVTKTCLSELGVTPFDSYRTVRHCLQAWTEYNTGTCAAISPGSYTVTTAPKHGKLSYGTITAQLGNGDCAGKTFTFATAYYTWTDMNANAPQDPLSIDWKTPDGEFDYNFPMTAVLAPRITVPNVVWWMNGQTPAGYSTDITLTAAPAGLPSYTWKVTGGEAYVKLDASTTSTVKVTSAKGSVALNDVLITVTANGGVSNPFKLTVKQPKTLTHLSNVDTADAMWGYESDVHYKIFDQFGTVLPANVPLNEHWTTGVTADFAGMTWRRGANGGATVAPSDWLDQIQGEAAGVVPAPQAPHGGATKVYHWSGDWSVGSADPSGGKGVKVQSNTWQKFRDHARHTNVVSPSAGENDAAGAI